MVTAVLPEGASAWTRELADAALPEEIERREVLDGQLIVEMGAPRLLHQVVVTHLLVELSLARPAGWLALGSPLDVPMPWGDVAQPDIVVLQPTQFEMVKGVLLAPTMLVEVLSPSTSGRDLVVKRRLYERHGTAHYVIVDADERTFTWLRRDDLGRLVEVAVAPERMRMDVPFEVELTLPAAVLWRL